MAFHPSAASQITARVASVNDKGIKPEGSDDWLNYSKWSDPITPPQRGELVAITLDKSGFIRRVEAVERQPEQAPAAAPSTKDQTITRLAVLRSAVQLAQGRTDLSSADVLKVAERFEAWVLRPAGEGLSND